MSDRMILRAYIRIGVSAVFLWQHTEAKAYTGGRNTRAFTYQVLWLSKGTAVE